MFSKDQCGFCELQVLLCQYFEIFLRKNLFLELECQSVKLHPKQEGLSVEGQLLTCQQVRGREGCVPCSRGRDVGSIADEFAMTRTWSCNLSSGTTRLTNPCNRASTEKFLLRLCFLFSLNPLKMVLYKYFYISDGNTKFNHRCVV